VCVCVCVCVCMCVSVCLSVCHSELTVISCYTEEQTLTKRKVALRLNTTR
jgi:hypothetical protein